ncbi:hypothetical protein HK105_204542 [Polyrhizophydium stewartii]|uniref:Uncharacterized protein n=1 Tax=Polyrhizophydium stewartii TaxID=2732419 RepID=A0ABR4N8P6_9FUNG
MHPPRAATAAATAASAAAPVPLLALLALLLPLLPAASAAPAAPASAAAAPLSPAGGAVVARVDRPSPFSRAHTVTTFRAAALPAAVATQAKVARPAVQPFQFTFSCADASVAVCESARLGFERAGALIANSLQIATTINVQATFRSFCNAAGKARNCDLGNTLGQAAAAAYFSAKLDNASEWAFYPQALIKQMQPDHSLQFNQYDIVAEFNADFPFFFRNSNRTILANETDFEFVVCHELTHGLGFDTAWASYYTVYSGMTRDSSYLAPLVYLRGSNLNSAVVTSFEPINIWDMYVQRSADSQALSALARTITSFGGVGTELPKFLSGFEASGAPYRAGRDVFSAVTAGSRAIAFKPKSGDLVYLQTKGGLYQPGSSIAHVDYDTYWTSPDFLMIPAVQNLTGSSLDDIIKSNTKGVGLDGGIYGPGTKNIMASIGWTLAGQSTVTLRIAINPSPDLPKSGALARAVAGASLPALAAALVSTLVSLWL